MFPLFYVHVMFCFNVIDYKLTGILHIYGIVGDRTWTPHLWRRLPENETVWY